jgi:hypothetical protein
MDVAASKRMALWEKPTSGSSGCSLNFDVGKPGCMKMPALFRFMKLKQSWFVEALLAPYFA